MSCVTCRLERAKKLSRVLFWHIVGVSLNRERFSTRRYVVKKAVKTKLSLQNNTFVCMVPQKPIFRALSFGYNN